MVEMLKQDEASTSKSFLKMPSHETEERTVITITTDSQTTDGEGNRIAADENTGADEVTEIHAPPPTATTGRTLTAETPVSSSGIGCSTEISARTNGRDPTATPTAHQTPLLKHRKKVKYTVEKGVV